MKRFLIWIIEGYRNYISSMHPPCCRYNPTCSAYALEAIEKHGAFKGFWLALLRILRCNPFSKGGYDPVPPVKEKKNKERDK
ncbi:MAG: membrane protein insertion efficiency factor YidD [Clostridia bacterium]|nr:membrane protein insertion efficiency factor YidD [Clostridia bacterium]